MCGPPRPSLCGRLRPRGPAAPSRRVVSSPRSRRFLPGLGTPPPPPDLCPVVPSRSPPPRWGVQNRGRGLGTRWRLGSRGRVAPWPACEGAAGSHRPLHSARWPRPQRARWGAPSPELAPTGLTEPPAPPPPRQLKVFSKRGLEGRSTRVPPPRPAPRAALAVTSTAKSATSAGRITHSRRRAAGSRGSSGLVPSAPWGRVQRVHSWPGATQPGSWAGA